MSLGCSHTAVAIARIAFSASDGKREMDGRISERPDKTQSGARVAYLLIGDYKRNAIWRRRRRRLRLGELPTAV